MKKQYYTPEKKEFYIGFEYESQEMLPSGAAVEWKSQVFEEQDVLHSIFQSNAWYDGPRVKYLDREDIESLGFIFKKHWVKESDGDIYHKSGYGLTWFKNTNSFCIWSNDYEEINLFKGKIKNKSELKVLLKQIGIS